MKNTAFYLNAKRRGTLTFDYAVALELETQSLRINSSEGFHVQLLTLVPVVDRLLAIGPCGFSVISVRLVVALAFQDCGHRGGRSAGVVESNLVPACTRTSRPQSLAGGKFLPSER